MGLQAHECTEPMWRPSGPDFLRPLKPHSLTGAPPFELPKTDWVPHPFAFFAKGWETTNPNLLVFPINSKDSGAEGAWAFRPMNAPNRCGGLQARTFCFR